MSWNLRRYAICVDQNYKKNKKTTHEDNKTVADRLIYYSFQRAVYQWTLDACALGGFFMKSAWKHCEKEKKKKNRSIDKKSNVVLHA